MSDSEEEILVFANFEEGTVDPDIFKVPDVNIKIIGLETATPIVQLDDSTFKGQWNDAIGTKVLLESDPAPPQVDQAFIVQPPNMYKCKCQTSKVLELSRFFLKPKHDRPASATNSLSVEDASINEDTVMIEEENSILFESI